MLDRLQRIQDTDGLPRVRMSSPNSLFSELWSQSELLCTWSGELFLELHNGTYTTQAQIKRGNRQCETLLHDVEVYSCLALSRDQSFQYPVDRLQELWRLLLLNQFHDVIPGSCIELVVEDALRYYEDIRDSGSRLLKNALTALGSGGSSGGSSGSNSGSSSDSDGSGSVGVFNSLCWERQEVTQVHSDTGGSDLALVQVPSVGFSPVKSADPHTPVSVMDQADGTILMNNGILRAVVNKDGTLVSLCLVTCSREALLDSSNGNQFVLFDDVPLYWDAWDVMDYHLQTRRPVVEVLEPARVLTSEQLRATVRFSLRISDKSTITQDIVMDAMCPYLKFHTQVDWNESHRFLKVEFPVQVHSPSATYEIQFGHLQRPTHHNTSWDWARFEVWGHKWADLSEHNFGVALLNDCKYGYSVYKNVMTLSLLRAPKAPDANADMGSHQFTYAIMPHSGSFQDSSVIQCAYNLNYPLRLAQHPLQAVPWSAFSVSSPAVILETIKQSEEQTRTLVLRLYESHGGTVTAALNTSLPVRDVWHCDLLERRDLSRAVSLTAQGIILQFKPFQIISLLLVL
ncbi:hypothetical protein NQD34_003897 [Periophthalmus magnuspinnatus]|nr:hypothetical protein NQD34_003897 [Periophthalmus magnuspinnatus]